MANPAQPVAFWMGSTIHTRFGGTLLKLLCDLSGTFDQSENLSLHVSIDGGPVVSISGNRNNNQLITIASGLGGSFVFNNNAMYCWDRLACSVFYDARVDTDHNGTIDDGDDYHRNSYKPTVNFPEIANKGSFGAHPQDVIIVGDGQNDQFQSSSFWVPNYRQLVTLLKKVYPNAQIVMTMTCMTGNTGYIASAHSPLVDEIGPGGINEDRRLHSLLLYANGNAEEGHPSANQHRQMACGNVNCRGLID
jgi:hypothetical protein